MFYGNVKLGEIKFLINSVYYMKLQASKDP